MGSSDASAMQLGPLAETVMAFLRTMERLVSDVRGTVTSEHWAALEELVAVDEFERLVPENAFPVPAEGSGTASDDAGWSRTVTGWSEYRELLDQWASSSPRYENVVQRVAELPGLVYLEVEEHHRHGDDEQVFNSLSTYEFNDERRICRIRVAGAANRRITSNPM